MTKKMKKVLAASALVLSVGAGAAFMGCVTPNKPDPDDSKDPHVCEHVCDDCGKCTDTACTDPVCADKCEGHEPGVDPKPVQGKLSLTSTVTATIGSSAAEATEIELDGVEAGDYTITVNGGMLLGQATVTVVVGETVVELTNNYDGTHSGKITIENETSIKVYTNAGNDVEDVTISLAEYEEPNVDPDPDPDPDPEPETPTELKAGANEVTIPESGELKCVLKITSGLYVFTANPAEGVTLEYTYGEAITLGEGVEVDNGLEILVKGTADTTVTITLTKQSRTLEAPFLTLNRDTREITWAPIDNAKSYTIYENGSEIITVFEPTYTISDSLTIGEYIYTVVANGDGSDYKDSEKSNEIEWVVEGSADLVVGQSAEIVLDGFNVTKTIALEAKTYTIKLTGEYASHFKVFEESYSITSEQAKTHAGDNGDLVLAGVTSTAVAFTVTEAKVYSLRFIDMSFDGHGCTVEIVEGNSETQPEAPKVYILTADTPETIEIKANEALDYKFTSGMAGIYEIVLTDIDGDGYTVKVDNSDTIDGDFGKTSGIFEASLETEYTVTFFSGSARTFTATVSYKRPLDVILEANGSDVSGTLATKSSGIDVSESENVGKLVFTNLKANYKYTVVVTFARGQFTDYRLIYNGKEYNCYNVSDDSTYRVDFVATDNGDGVVSEGYFYGISTMGQPVPYTVKLIEGEEVEDSEFGLVKTITLTLNVSNSMASGTLSELDGLAAGGYKLVITADGGFFGTWEGITIMYNGGGTRFGAVGAEHTYNYTGSGSFSYSAEGNNGTYTITIEVYRVS